MRIRRVLLITLCIAGLLFAGVRLGFVIGWRQTARIHGGSMVDALLGDHFATVCPDCGFGLALDADDPPAGGRIVCPNCGFTLPPDASLRRAAGDRVLIDAWPTRGGRVRRWQPVVLTTPDQTESLSVKRIVGLPGETITIDHGDVFVDGRIQRKSLDQLRTIAVLVHDSAYQPRATPESPARWQPEAATSRWESRAGTHVFAAADDSPDEIAQPQPPSFARFDWLSYRHWRCVDSPLPRTDESPILDNYGYNQNVSRQLHAVTDLLLVADLAVEGSGRIAFRIDDGRGIFVVSLDPQSYRGKLRYHDRQVADFTLPRAAYMRQFRAELAVFDHRFALAIDGQQILCIDYTPAAPQAVPKLRPLAIGSDGLGVRSGRLQVFRDVHYLSPHGLNIRWQAAGPLGADEVFVLGDNVPISRDSRHWPGGVKIASVAGEVRSWR